MNIVYSTISYFLSSNKADDMQNNQFVPIQRCTVHTDLPIQVPSPYDSKKPNFLLSKNPFQFNSPVNKILCPFVFMAHDPCEHFQKRSKRPADQQNSPSKPNQTPTTEIQG